MFSTSPAFYLYTLPCEKLIGHVLPLGKEKIKNLFHLNYGTQICQIWVQLITVCGSIAREGVQNTHQWYEWPETAIENGMGVLWVQLDHVVIAAAIRQWRRW